VGDALDNALAESVIGLFKTELVRRRAPWRTVEHIEAETLHWVDWVNHHRLLEVNGDLPPVEFEEADYHELDSGTLRILQHVGLAPKR
jgi:putative transposase